MTGMSRLGWEVEFTLDERTIARQIERAYGVTSTWPREIFGAKMEPIEDEL